MANIIKLKGTGSISADREILNANYQSLNIAITELDSSLNGGDVQTNSDFVENLSTIPGGSVTAALNNILTLIPTGNELLIVNTYGDLPTSPTSGDMAFVRDLQIKSTAVSALYVYDTDWVILSRSDANTYVTDLNDIVESPGIDIPAGTTVLDLKGITFSKFIDDYIFTTVLAYISQNESTLLTFAGASSIVEVGTSIDVTLTGTFNRGSIENGDNSAGPDLVGTPNQYEFTGPGIATSVVITSSNLTEIIDTTNIGFSIFAAVFGSQRWNVDIDYDIGSGNYYDSKGNLSSNLDTDRVAGTSSDISPTTTGRYNAFYDVGIIPINSAEVRSAANTIFLDGSNNGSFNITIPASTPEVFFSVPTGKTVQVLYVESSNADVTGSFSSNSFDVNDAGGTPVAYDTLSSTIGGGGYPAIATYTVTIS